MSRVKRGIIKSKHRRNLLASAKGYRFRRKSSKRLAKEAIVKAGAHRYRHRRDKKREMRGLWNIKIGAAAKLGGTSYSKFIHALKQKNSALDRKILADLAENEPEAFGRILKEVV